MSWERVKCTNVLLKQITGLEQPVDHKATLNEIGETKSLTHYFSVN